MEARITIKEAAGRLQLPEQTLRLWIQNGTCPFGDIVIQRGGGRKKNTYYINTAKLNKYLEQ